MSKADNKFRVEALVFVNRGPTRITGAWAPTVEAAVAKFAAKVVAKGHQSRPLNMVALDEKDSSKVGYQSHYDSNITTLAAEAVAALKVPS
jgi:hypothetical protein